jgi:hypothetical protein
MSAASGIRLASRAALCCLALAGFAPARAAAAGGAPQWTVTAVSRPTNFRPELQPGVDAYVVTVTNTGGASSDGSPVVITDELPQGLSLDPIGASGQLAVAKGSAGANFECVLRTCTYSGVVVPGNRLLITFPVDVSSAPIPASCAVPATASNCVTNAVHVAGGGAPAAGVTTPTLVSTTEAPFGVSPGGMSTALSSVQAGAHPDITTAISFNTVNAQGSLAGDEKEVIDDLPPGFAGADLVDTPSCPASQFLLSLCAIDTQVGVVAVTLAGIDAGTPTVPVYNLTPDPGEAAKLGFFVAGNVYVEGGIYLRSDYGPRAVFQNIYQGRTEVVGASLTLWGVPADSVHDPLRCKHEEANPALCFFGTPSSAPRVPFFTNPTICETQPLDAVFTVNSWQEPGNELSAQAPFGPIVACDRLSMQPSLSAELTTPFAYAPSGLDLNMTIPQTYNNPEGLATSNLEQAVVTLPEGMTVNPSAGAGLGVCSQAQFEEEASSEAPGRGCPNDSKLGTVKSQSPALKEESTGSVFLAQPYDNPFGSLLALYIVARIPERGIVVKAAGEVSTDSLTGRLVATFDTSDPRQPHGGLPPVPFSTFTFAFRQGSTSPLVTPPSCGSYTVTAELTPWSNPQGAPLTPPIPPMTIASGLDSGPCPSGGAPSFAPKVLAGTQQNRAGSYGPMYIRVIREDGEQEITRFSAVLPPGLTANLSGVPFCSNADIQSAREKTGEQEETQPSCPAASQIGHTLVGAGVGSVLVWAPGRVYMGGPYNGAPFSIVAITSAKVGPFDLGTVVVRDALKIDPTTAVVSVDASASDPIPHIIKGIVIHVRDIRVYVDRPTFTLNPTNCERMTFSATVSGSGADFTSPADDVPVKVNDPFQAADCQALTFKPTFKASTSGRTSRARGASLTVKLSYPIAPPGTQANIRSVKVSLPRQLPSRLATLQKACPAVTFNADPAACPAASRVGIAKAITPILPVALEGPAYFVSHGGAKFPELIIVLQGYGVTIDLHGETFISKQGITSSTFRAVPDQPVDRFELTLPQGLNSALAAHGNLCKDKLKMPTIFTAQNGFTVRQSTSMTITKCPKQRPPAARRHHKHRHRHRSNSK